MKTIIMKTIISLLKIQVILWMLISMLCSVNLVSQTFEGNVDIPGGDGKGAMIGDILNANGLVFSYTLDKLFIYSSDGTYVDEITFETDYGKFNPYFYRERYCASSLSLMAYNETDQVLYVISPNLQIKIIDISDPQDITVSTYEDSQLPSTFSPLHGLSILKYDRIHRRIYWVIDGREPRIGYNRVGSFHVRHRYFAIYKVDNYGNISLYYNEHKQLNSPDPALQTPGLYEDISISDIEFNLNDENNNNLNLVQSLATDNSENLYTSFDLNVPFKLVHTQKDEAIICKEDEVCHLHKVGSTYESTTILEGENNYFMNASSFTSGNNICLEFGAWNL